MATRTRKAKVPLLNNKINILNGNATEASPTKKVFRTVSNILTLVRDEMIDNEDHVYLSEYCFDVCDVLETVIQGKNTDGLHESVRVAIKDLERVMCEIERTLKLGVEMSHIEYDKGELEGRKLEIRGILGTILGTLNTPLNENPTLSERSPHPAPVDPRDTATAPTYERACRRLIRRVFTLHELPSLIEAVFSSEDVGDTIRSLRGDDAQTFIDVMNEALDRTDLSSRIREKCFKSLHRMCGQHALIPSALKIPISYNRTGDALYRGGFADVWKGKHRGRDVAVKVIRIYSNSDLRKVIGRFCKEVVTWKTLQHPNVLPLVGVTMSKTRFAMISNWMANGNINDFVKAHPDANRLELLRGVARGLFYIHTQGMIHGDLKGANILIDQAGNARLADFGLLTIISDPANLLSSSSYAQGGTVRWMSPERIAPDRFGFKDSRPTKPSDCYALGMVIYETITGDLPFHKDADLTVFMKVVEGERPPRRAGFTRSLWTMLELCWAHKPNNRPSTESVLRCLEFTPNLPPSPWVGEGMDEGSRDGDSAGSAGFSNRTRGMRTSSNSHQDPLAVFEAIGAGENPGFDIQTSDYYRSSSTHNLASEAFFFPQKSARLAGRIGRRQPSMATAKGPLPPPPPPKPTRPTGRGVRRRNPELFGPHSLDSSQFESRSPDWDRI